MDQHKPLHGDVKTTCSFVISVIHLLKLHTLQSTIILLFISKHFISRDYWAATAHTVKPLHPLLRVRGHTKFSMWVRMPSSQCYRDEELLVTHSSPPSRHTLQSFLFSLSCPSPCTPPAFLWSVPPWSRLKVPALSPGVSHRPRLEDSLWVSWRTAFYYQTNDQTLNQRWAHMWEHWPQAWHKNMQTEHLSPLIAFSARVIYHIQMCMLCFYEVEKQLKRAFKSYWAQQCKSDPVS